MPAAAQPPQPAMTPTNTKAKMTVLVVDDTPDNLTLLSGILKGDYRVLLATNGAKALEICTSDEPPDLVLLDVMMPEMDGFEVARRMREHPNSESTPVIFVTALTTNEARTSGLELGAVDFLTKPVDPQQLLSRVRNFMRYVQLRKSVQSDFDNMVEMARLRDEVDQLTRHDIKGPLAGALDLVRGLIRDSAGVPAQASQLALIEDTVVSILNMVNLSSDLLKIETGTYVLNATPVELLPIVQSVSELQKRVFSSKDVSLEVRGVSIPGGKPLSILGDATLCYSAIQNLLKNAFEASPDGATITLSIEYADPVRLVILNSGVVPAAIRDTAFEKYVTHGKPGGTGLGLYSARLLCRAQRGDVELIVDDALNTTSVVVTLPRG
jgi:DNA-binding response OmpR family regulator